VADPAHRRHRTAHQPAPPTDDRDPSGSHRLTTPSARSHADTRAKANCPPSPPETHSFGLCVANAAANTGASVETEPSIKPANPGCTTCQHEQPAPPSRPRARRFRIETVAAQRLGTLAMRPLFPAPGRSATAGCPRLHCAPPRVRKNRRVSISIAAACSRTASTAAGAEARIGLRCTNPFTSFRRISGM